MANNPNLIIGQEYEFPNYAHMRDLEIGEDYVIDGYVMRVRGRKEHGGIVAQVLAPVVFSPPTFVDKSIKITIRSDDIAKVELSNDPETPTTP